MEPRDAEEEGERMRQIQAESPESPRESLRFRVRRTWILHLHGRMRDKVPRFDAFKAKIAASLLPN